MNFIEHIHEMDQTIEKRREEEYRKTMFDSSSSASAGLGFAGSMIVNGQPFSVIGDHGSYIINGDSFNIIGGGF